VFFACAVKRNFKREGSLPWLHLF